LSSGVCAERRLDRASSRKPDTAPLVSAAGLRQTLKGRSGQGSLDAETRVGIPEREFGSPDGGTSYSAAIHTAPRGPALPDGRRLFKDDKARAPHHGFEAEAMSGRIPTGEVRPGTGGLIPAPALMRDPIAFAPTRNPEDAAARGATGRPAR